MAALQSGAASKAQHEAPRPWDTVELQTLRALRRTCTEKVTRARLSKQIQKKTRYALRTWQNSPLQSQLESFTDLKQLSRICNVPTARQGPVRPEPVKFAESLRKVCESEEAPLQTQPLGAYAMLPAISVGEVASALKSMRTGRCQDRHGMIAEMLRQGGPSVEVLLAELYTKMIHTGHIPEN